MLFRCLGNWKAGRGTDLVLILANLRIASRIEMLEPRAMLAAFNAGNLLVYRVDGSALAAPGLFNTGAQVFLDEYSPSGALVQSIALPSTLAGTAGNLNLVASGDCFIGGLDFPKRRRN